MSIPDNVSRQVLEAENDVVLITQADSIDAPGPEIVYVNTAFEELTGFSKEEVIGKSPRILQGPNTSIEAKERIRLALENQEAVRTTIFNYSKQGNEYWSDISIIPLMDENGVVTHFAAIERDVTEQKMTNDRLEALSKIDGLTGLLNYRAFHAEVTLEMQRIRRISKKTNGFSIIELDIDHFKKINDTHGHDVGDSVLRQLGKLISDAVRQIDRAGRVGGEEFCIILPSTALHEAQEIAERLRKTIAEHYFASRSTRLKITVSLGVATQSNEQENYTTTLKNADRALYKAKREGRNRTCVGSSDE